MMITMRASKLRLTRMIAASGAAILLALLGIGCGALHTVVSVPGQTLRAVTPGGQAQPGLNPLEVQQALLRFANDFSAGLLIGVGQLRRGTNVLDSAEVLEWKLAFGTEICAIASGPNPVANLLDMT